jgi:hypothetical protein
MFEVQHEEMSKRLDSRKGNVYLRKDISICLYYVLRFYRNDRSYTGGLGMNRLKKYLNRSINLQNIKNEKALEGFGFSCRYLPDPPDVFDEFEFKADLGGIENLALMITIESMAIKRLFFGAISSDNPDLITGLDEMQLQEIFRQSEVQLFRFLDFITK